MTFNWQALSRLILALSRSAMEWYRLVETNPGNDDTKRAAKVASIVLDPDRPEQDPSEVVDE